MSMKRELKSRMVCTVRTMNGVVDALKGAQRVANVSKKKTATVLVVSENR